MTSTAAWSRPPRPYGIYSFRKGQRFYFLNLLEELDQPGEWFLDRKTGVLYFWPRPPSLAQVRGGVQGSRHFRLSRTLDISSFPCSPNRC